MIGILNRWRQFGRRYFWPHLLLGMVAASLGLPQANASDAPTLPETAARSLNISNAVRFDSLAFLQESARRPSFNVDYWHNHAIRTVIRHLSFSLTPVNQPDTAQAIPLQVQKLALLDTLSALLTHDITPAPVIARAPAFRVAAYPGQATGLWLAQVQGIRAGPASLV